MKKGIIAALIAANLLMLVVGVITIPPNLLKAAGKEPAASPSEQTPSTSPKAKQTMTPAPSTAQPTPAPTSVPETPPAPTAGEVPSSEPAYEDLSTEERPSLEDFIWFTEEAAHYGVPSEANIIDNLGRLTGGWKGLIIYDPDNLYDSAAIELLNVAIAGTEDNLSLTLDWYLIFWMGDGETYDETGEEDYVYYGKWEGSGLWASGAGTIRLTQFYELNGNQLAVGTMDTPDGIPALVALARP